MIRRRQPRLRILVTAGPTREPIDLVRYISNCSSGITGFAIANEAKRLGHAVILISGPVNLKFPSGVKAVNVMSARQMLSAVMKNFKSCDCLIMCAAVADYRSEKVISGKIDSGRKTLNLKLIKNPDILETAAKAKNGKILVGFCVETKDLLKEALKKLEKKNLDLIVANQVSGRKSPFGPVNNNYILIDRFGGVERFNNLSKQGLAKKLIEKIRSFC